MARPKKFQDPVTCSFKLERVDMNSLKDFASSCGQDVSDVLLELVTGLVAANKERIENFHQNKNSAVKATFAEPTPPKKSARPSKKKKPAQATSGEGDVTNAEN